MKNKVLKAVIAGMLIIVITLADFILLGVNLVTYALENVDNSTSNENVKFAAYFKTEGENEVSQTEYQIDNNNMKLYLKVSVKNEGYFDGVITLKDSNFKLKEEVLSDNISKIEGNTITLNRVRAGNTAEIEVGIEPIIEESYGENMLSKESMLELSGNYKDSTEKDISINAQKKVKLTLLAPSNIDTALKSKVITNRIYKIGEEEKRIVQIEISSTVVENAYPIKSTTIEVALPEGAKVEEVITKGTYATNGEADKKLEYKAPENNILKVAIENTSKNGKISWKKGAEDIIVVTLTLGKDTKIGAEEYSIKSKVELQENESAKVKEAKYNLTKEADGIITTSVENNEEIYKGKIYSKEEREYKTTTNIEVNHANLVETATLEEKTIYRKEKNTEELQANIEYKTTTIRKAEVEKILGQEGILTIKSGSDEIKITKDTEADENGNIVVTHKAGVKELQVEITKAVQTGIIRLNHTKVIKGEAYTKEQIKEINYLVDQAKVKYNLAENSFEKIKNLRETTSEVGITVMPQIISSENKDIQMAITLKTDDERYELYENPTLKITMPEGVKINSVTGGTISAGVLSISKLEKNNQKEITLEIAGTQQKYVESNINTQISFTANVSVEKLMANKIDTIKIEYTNKGETRQLSSNINIVASNAKMVTHLKLENYNGLGTSIEKYSDSSKEVKAELPLENPSIIKVPVKYTIINNHSSAISVNASIEAILTDKDENVESLINYSNQLTIEAGKMQTIEQILEVPAGLYYSEKIDVEAVIKYNYSGTEYSVSNEINLATEGKQGIRDIKNINNKIQVETFSQLGDGTGIKENDSVYNEQIVQYVIELTNISDETISNLKITNNQENGKIYDLKEVVVINYAISPEEMIEHRYAELDTNTMTFAIESLEPGETKEILCRVVAKKTEQNDITSANISISANGIQEQQIQKISNKVKDSTLKVITEKALNQEVQLYGNATLHTLTYVTNLSDISIKNAKVRLYLSEGLTWKENYTVEAMNLDEEDLDILRNITYNEEGNYLEFNITALEAKQEIIISVFTYIKSLPLDEISREEIVYTQINDVISNDIRITVEQLETEISVSQSINTQEGQRLKDGEKVIITGKITNVGHVDTSIEISDNLPKGLVATKVEIIKDNETIDKTENNQGSYVMVIENIKQNETITIKIEAEVNVSLTTKDELTNKINVAPYRGKVAISNEVTILIENNIDTSTGIDDSEYVEPDDGKVDDDKPDDGKPDDGKPDDGKPDEGKPDDGKGDEEQTYVISGCVWVDKNKNGSIESDEFVKDVIVKIIDLDNKNTFLTDENGKEIEAKTDKNGLYKIKGVPKGNYNIIFKYDTAKYELIENENMKDYIIENTKEKIAITRNIALKADEVIDLKLVELTKFDLQMDKYISKVIVQTANGTKTTNYSDQQLIREEIQRKYMEGATVLVEYTMKISNTGELAGYATEIMDYLPKDMKFYSELNKQWYMGEDGNLYNVTLATDIIEPGESKTVTLVLSKSMTRENSGTITNIAEISDTMNSKEYADIDLSNNQSKAEVIVNTATGTIITYIVAVLNAIVIVLVGLYVIKKKVVGKE